ncbi:hypothetical protein ACH0CG_00720 [Microbacterium sp. 179-I 1D1 NHS]|uniref:hypothetical protein n=1 Tax=Microbacterium sp. 179-I 1D1 NHS TaxID=3374298 RepID=UPI00387A7FBE
MPISSVALTVLAQERKAIPLVNEFTLRAAGAEVRRIADIATLLGLDSPLVEAAVVELSVQGHVRYDAESRAIELTPEGKALSRVHAELRPVARAMRLLFDRITWSVADYPRESLIPKKQAIDAGLLLLPAAHTRRIAREDIPLRRLNRVIAGADARGRKLEILRVVKVQNPTYMYARCDVLVFASSGRNVPPELGVVIEDQLSTEHDIALARAGGAEALRIAVDPNHHALDGGQPVEPVDHWPSLQEALASEAERITVSSGAVSAAVVDANFLGRLKDSLGRGAQIDIVFYRDESPESEQAGRRGLESLAEDFPNLRVVVASGDVPEMLIVDDAVLQTTFRWLAHRTGAMNYFPTQAGRLVTDRELADALRRSVLS